MGVILLSHAIIARTKRGNIIIVAMRRLFIGKLSNFQTAVDRWTRSNRRRARGLHHRKEFQYNEYDGDNDQEMDPAAGARKAWTYIPTKKAEQPQYY